MLYFRSAHRNVCALVFFLFVATLASAIDAKQLAEAQALLDRAEQLSSITLPNSDPFMLQLRIEGTPSKITGTGGLYKLWWAADDKWRERAESGDVSGVEVRNEQGLWIPQELDPRLEGVFSGGRVFPFRGKLLRWNEKIIGLHERKVDGAKLSCVVVQSSTVQPELCFDTGTGLLIRVSFEMRAPSQSPILKYDTVSWYVGEFVTEFRNYTAVGNKMLPREMQKIYGGQVASTIRLVGVSISPKFEFASYMFAAPDKHQAWPTCDHYHPATYGPDFVRQSRGVIAFGLLGSVEKVADGVRIVVAPDGKAQHVSLINPTGRPEKQLIPTFMGQIYQPATCDGKPVLGFLTIY